MVNIFIIGSHRTGTKTLAHFFNDCFLNVKSYHQYDTLRWINVFSNAYLAGRLSESLFYKFLDVFWIKKIKSHKVKHYVESNGFNFISAAYAKKKLLNVKIVHIVRDPRDFVTSYYNWVEGRKKSAFASKYIPFWNLSGAEVGSLSYDVWNNMTRFERYCWLWYYKNKKIEELYSSDKETYFFLRLEDLINTTTREKTLTSLLNFLSLPYEQDMLSFFDVKRNQSKKEKMSNWKNWDKEWVQKLENICEELMRKYKY